MRPSVLMLAAAAVTWSAAARADIAAEIRTQEAAWEQAFRTGDTAFLQSLLAPEYRLMRAENGRIIATSRAQWFANLAGYKFHEFEARVVDVAVDGDTAVATVEGHWKVGIPGRGTREENFILSDTFVKRGGTWQVLYRHSSPSPRAAAGKAERGR
jgi:ketosteroid isomerase-like protein